MALTTDFLIIGGGVIGLNLALQIRRRHSASKIILIEKESHCGKHASGRNSGVLHAGFYYTADSLKARFTREGNSCMTEYCRTRGLRINRCGKLVVAKDPADLAGLEELLERAQKNGVELHEITDKEARAIEPRIKTYGKALYSPTTASVDPGEVMISLVDDAQKAGINILTNTAYRRYKAPAVVTNKGRIAAGYVINAAGLYADKIAQDFGFSKDYRILPFKGIYLYSSEQPGALKTNIYPVPDLNHPFLGVHYTLTVDGKIKIGPTAIPAFWREHYQGLDNFNLRESIEILGRELGMFLRNDFGFRSLAFNEIQKHFKSKLLMPNLSISRNENYKWTFAMKVTIVRFTF
jgi:L-2-hydroxyglutarate oxidase LhgO